MPTPTALLCVVLNFARAKPLIAFRERGRPARNEREARTGIVKPLQKCAPAARCGRDARAPSKELPLIIKLHQYPALSITLKLVTG
jgi:hypothetical protein